MNTYYEIDSSGQIIASFDSNPQVSTYNTIIHSTPPPSTMLKPRYIANQWTEAATLTEQEAHIDQQTDQAIKQWCKDKGKNEEWYINCGIKIAIDNIQDSTNDNIKKYNEYKAFRDKQIELGKKKKAAL